MWYHDDYTNIEREERPHRQSGETEQEFRDRCRSLNMFFVSSNSLLYSFNNGYINRNSPKTSALYPLNALQHIPEIITGWAEKIEKNENSIQQIAQLLAATTEWHKEQDLKRLKNDLKILDKKIEESMKKEEQPVKEAA